mgnify:CR=1 FL=1
MASDAASEAVPPSTVAPTFLSSTASLVLGCAGAGVLAFPWALAQARLPAFLIGGACACAVSFAGMSVLARHSAVSAAAPWCFEKIFDNAFGAYAARAATLAVACQQFGSMVQS